MSLGFAMGVDSLELIRRRAVRGMAPLARKRPRVASGGARVAVAAPEQLQDVVAQAHPGPFCIDRSQASQRELSEPSRNPARRAGCRRR